MNSTPEAFRKPAAFVPWLVKKEGRLSCDADLPLTPADKEALRNFPERLKEVQEKAQRALIIAEFVDEVYNGRGRERE